MLVNVVRLTFVVLLICGHAHVQAAVDTTLYGTIRSGGPTATTKPTAATGSDSASLTALAAQAAAEGAANDTVGVLGESTAASPFTSPAASSPVEEQKAADTKAESGLSSAPLSSKGDASGVSTQEEGGAAPAGPPSSRSSGVLENDVSQWHTARKGEELVYQSDRHGTPLHAEPPHDHLREHYPQCPADCLEDWIADGWCDSECNIAECGYDGPDCQGWCGGECRPGWPGDGQCDLECYKEECDWDGGDCPAWSGRNLPSIHTLQRKIEEGVAQGDDAESVISSLLKADLGLADCECARGKLGNGVCNPECNTYECQFDGFDCRQMCSLECPHVWLGDGKCDKECDIPECYHDKGDCETCGENCRTWMIGNGMCDPACNTRECFFDNGDCNGITAVIAVDYDAKPYVYQFCAREFIGDGNCDENCYNEESEWDGGDCRGTPLAKRLAAEGVGPQFASTKKDTGKKVDVEQKSSADKTKTANPSVEQDKLTEEGSLANVDEHAKQTTTAGDSVSQEVEQRLLKASASN
ncbi:notch (dsl) domain-containing protein [Besnoitia besnoiti]|uniref:Notch (Dsl) domain-containing protein n=1 Tax=Besnoitia besnoiti TaxID=94643 RepID=A0A2A9MFU3_BESBE|nr:notch (dsl) domain-containing protein [Besnoitia besnoiti]PFH34846.1 notch (dsl) domain-containing protein [Besnoitia besnoiti]